MHSAADWWVAGICIIAVIAIILALWRVFMYIGTTRTVSEYQPRHQGAETEHTERCTVCGQWQDSRQPSGCPHCDPEAAMRLSADTAADDAYAEMLAEMNSGVSDDHMSGWERSVTRWEREQEDWQQAMAAGPWAVWDYLGQGWLRVPQWINGREAG